MTRPTKHAGYRDPRTPSSDRLLSPRRPYTGDGVTTRSIFDRVQAVMRKADGAALPAARKAARTIAPAAEAIWTAPSGRCRVTCRNCGLIGSGLTAEQAGQAWLRHRVDGCNLT